MECPFVCCNVSLFITNFIHLDLQSVFIYLAKDLTVLLIFPTICLTSSLVLLCFFLPLILDLNSFIFSHLLIFDIFPWFLELSSIILSGQYKISPVLVLWISSYNWLHMSHRFEYVVFSFLLNSKKSLVTLLIFFSWPNFHSVVSCSASMNLLVFCHFYCCWCSALKQDGERGCRMMSTFLISVMSIILH